MVTFTIAIPTFNRSRRLIAQLDRLAPQLMAEQGRCGLLVSDNCSTDDTAEAVTSWIAEHPALSVTYRRNESNLGVMRNFAACAKAAEGDFVWILGDDDEVPPDTVQRLLGVLDANPDLTLLSVNYEMFDVPNDRVMTPARIRIQQDVVKPGAGPLVAQDDDGRPLVYLMGFMSAQVYRSEAIRRAIAEWPKFDNLDAQILWSAHRAQQGPALVKADVFLRYDCGTNPLARPKVWFRVHVLHSSKVFRAMRRIGYPAPFCRASLMIPVKSKHELKGTLSGMFRWPVLGLQSASYLAYALVVICLPAGG